MKKILSYALIPLLLVGFSALARADVEPEGAAPSSMPPAPPSEPPAPQFNQAQTAPAEPPASGQWVYTAQFGWTWMPYGKRYVSVSPGPDPYPYQYVYIGAGWTWVAAPWVWGWGARPWYGHYGPARFGWYRGPHYFHSGFRAGFHPARFRTGGFRGGAMIARRRHIGR